MGGHILGSLYKVEYMVDDRMAHGKVYCSVGEDTAKHRAQRKERTVAHTASYSYCGHSSFHMASDRGGNHVCKVPCTCESRSEDVHIVERRGCGSAPGYTCYRYRDSRAHILTHAYMMPYIQVALCLFFESKHLAGCAHN